MRIRGGVRTPELGWKLKRTGKVVYDPDNVVNTTYPDTWSDIWKKEVLLGYAMGLKFRNRCHSI